jgi:hypothetical protein
MCGNACCGGVGCRCQKVVLKGKIKREMCLLWGCGCQKVVLKGMRGPWGPLPRGTSQGDRVAVGQANEGGAHGRARRQDTLWPVLLLVQGGRQAGGYVRTDAGQCTAGGAWLPHPVHFAFRLLHRQYNSPLGSGTAASGCHP